MTERRKPSLRRRNGRLKSEYQMIVLLVCVLFLIIPHTIAATTSLHIIKYANDRTTILAEKNLTWQEMRDTLPVQGDGSTHYYHQGPVFVDDPDDAVEQKLRWNPSEDINVMEKDMGAVTGTGVKDLCDLVGGMAAGDTLAIVAQDGMSKQFAYKNVYIPSSRQGPMVITWSCSGVDTCTGLYPDSGYDDGMRLVFFADTSVNPWGAHVFGNYDWHESADEMYWYYYNGDAGERYPTTTGLSMKYVSEIRIYSTKLPPSERHGGSGVSNFVAPGAPPPEDTSMYGYRGRTVGTVISGMLNGSVQVYSVPLPQPVLANNRFREFNISIDIPPDSNLTVARLYLYISRGHDLQSGRGTVPWFRATFEQEALEEETVYIDTDGDEKRYVAATYAFDVQPLVTRNGSYRLMIHNLDPEVSAFTIDGVALISGYENESSPKVSYWITEGCDVISSIPKKGLFPDECRTDYTFAGTVNLTTATNATVYLISTGLDNETRTEHTVKFGTGTWQNLLDSSLFPEILQVPVTRLLNETGNNLSIESSIRSQDADYIINRNAILILQHRDPSALPGLNTSGGPGGLSVNTSEDREEPLLNTTPGQGPGFTGNERSEDLVNVTVPAVAANITDSTDNLMDENSSKLDLDTDPEGALIFLDGSYTGKTTPCLLNVENGTPRRIRFELSGYHPAETIVIPFNYTSIRMPLYNPVHTTKGRMAEEPADPDGTRYGGLYITSRPTGAMIFINGADTKKVTPSVFMGLESGTYTVRVVRVLVDKHVNDRSDFNFVDQRVPVQPGILLPVEINGIGYVPLYEVIIDSRSLRGRPFTLNGYLPELTIPKKVNTSLLNSFITVRENGSFVSYPVPILSENDRYWLFKSRDHQELVIAVDSDPPGAEIFIDGFRTGFATPYSIGNLSDGPHRIMVIKPGYLPAQSLIDLPRYSVPLSTTMVDFYLDEYPSGFLYANSSPPGAGSPSMGCQREK